MTPQQAKKILTEHMGIKSIDSCYEYSELYVFNTNSLSYSDESYAVNKETGEISVFLPFNISKQDYFSGKKVDIE